MTVSTVLREPEQIKILDLNLTSRAQRVCADADIQSLKDLIVLGEKGLSLFPMCGRKTIWEFKTVLSYYGFELPIEKTCSLKMGKHGFAILR